MRQRLGRRVADRHREIGGRRGIDREPHRRDADLASVLLGGLRSERDFELAAVTPELESQPLSWMRISDGCDIGRRAHRLAVDGKDGIARLEPSDRRRLAGHDVTHERHPEIELEAERAEKVSFPLAGVQRRE